MNPQTSMNRNLTDDERAALRHYGADSTYLHVAAQGRAADFERDAGWAAFWPNCKAITDGIDAAILASTLDHPTVLYSGHGNGLAVRGALEADPVAFVGMTYRYPGYISTSSKRDFCELFLEKRRNIASRPVLMNISLPSGFNAIDMVHGGHYGECEFLLGRNLHFVIVDARFIDGDILSIDLKPG